VEGGAGGPAFGAARGDARRGRPQALVSGCRWSTGPWPWPTEYDRRIASVR
jgi:hypothetical protein